MALTGVHVTCAYSGALGFKDVPISIIGKAIWAETLAAAGTTGNEATGPDAQRGTLIFQISSAADVFVSIGAAPDANGATKTRYFIRGGQAPVEIAVEKGDKLAWVAAV